MILVRSRMFSKSSLQRPGDMRTKEKHRYRDRPMFSEIKSVLLRSSDTLAADALGAMALVVMLVVGLHLPALI